MSGPLDVLTPEEREQAGVADQTHSVQPMLATLEHECFSDPGWIFERKLDGVQFLVFRRDGEVRLRTRKKGVELHSRVNTVHLELTTGGDAG